MNEKINFAFFGSSRFSTIVLDEFEKQNFLPSLIVTTPDKPQGRKMTITPNIVKVWANAHRIPCFDPAHLDERIQKELFSVIKEKQIELFIVAFYGKIIPKSIIDAPKFGTLNIHPSLLPLYRGPSPLQQAILDDVKDTGVSIMEIDEMMDHGPILAQENIHIDEWPKYDDFEESMARISANLLMKTVPIWVNDNSIAKEQNHKNATYTRKIRKEDAMLDLEADPYENFRKIQAYHTSPRAYFFHKYRGNLIKVIITDASYTSGKLVIKKVLPQDGKEISFDDFSNSYCVNS